MTAFRDTIANIERLKTELATDIPCENILGLVIYDLPGRDCAAKASNGELAVGELDRYKSEYIDGRTPFSPLPPCSSPKRGGENT